MPPTNTTTLKMKQKLGDLLLVRTIEAFQIQAELQVLSKTNLFNFYSVVKQLLQLA